MGTGTPGREAASLHPPSFPGSALAVRVGLFPCSAGRPFPRPGLRSGTGVARRGGQGRAQARPKGLVLDGPEHGARLGRSRDDGELRRVVVVGEPVRTQTSALAKLLRAPPRPSNTVTIVTSINASGLTPTTPKIALRGRRQARAAANPRTGRIRPIRARSNSPWSGACSSRHRATRRRRRRKSRDPPDGAQPRPAAS